MSRILPCDRARYLATVAALVAVYGVVWLLDRVSRRPTMPDGRWPWESDAVSRTGRCVRGGVTWGAC